MFHYVYLNNEIDAKASLFEQTETAIKPVKASAAETPHQYEWRNAGRLKQGRSLGKISRQQIWISQTFGALTLYALILILARTLLKQYNTVLDFIYNLLPYWAVQRLHLQSPFANYDHLVWKVLFVLSIAVLTAPWLWDMCLRFTTNRQTFSTQKLRQYSS